ncbi:diaminopimelate epimerase [Paenibacillus chitinolyticus]|uniref:diaminopimelate epimerase n=1 Tax=Paenibacillus chitinolyticus TaxID=79263 RepID=UPI002DBD67F6|nr:diaminopimelate epimerase [Paenibacillus chitinolyticus]MEC0249194.1 diaminopimelate epimerase [Paenibacillus chitinolyticus]
MKHEIDFVKCNPTQNMTILVRTNHLAEDYKPIAAKMMAYDSVYAEQVGFIEKPGSYEAAANLRMAGGEFCGNACMALAAFLASEKGMNPDDFMEIVLEASGTEQLVACQVKKVKEEYVCRLAMPVPTKIDRKTIKFEGDDLDIVTVRYPDFLHIVIEVDHFNEIVRNRAQTLAKLLGATSEASVIGILLFKSHSDELAPLIYVPPLDSMIWERGCGSGTASLGAFLSWKHQRDVSAQIKQPGGTMTVMAEWEEDEVTSLAVEGSVGIVAHGRAFIDV